MNSIVRNLEIYNLTAIGDTFTIDLSKRLSEMFTDITIKHIGDNRKYLKNDVKVMISDHMNSILWCSSHYIWRPLFAIKHLSENDVGNIIQYALRKYYNISEYEAAESFAF